MIWGKRATERTRVTEWHVWFAWRPVRLNDGRWAWWERIERRIEGGHSIGEIYCFYREIEKREETNGNPDHVCGHYTTFEAPNCPICGRYDERVGFRLTEDRE